MYNSHPPDWRPDCSPNELWDSKFVCLAERADFLGQFTYHSMYIWSCGVTGIFSNVNNVQIERQVEGSGARLSTRSAGAPVRSIQHLHWRSELLKGIVPSVRSTDGGSVDATTKRKSVPTPSSSGLMGHCADLAAGLGMTRGSVITTGFINLGSPSGQSDNHSRGRWWRKYTACSHRLVWNARSSISLPVLIKAVLQLELHMYI